MSPEERPDRHGFADLGNVILVARDRGFESVSFGGGEDLCFPREFPNESELQGCPRSTKKLANFAAAKQCPICVSPYPTNGYRP